MKLFLSVNAAPGLLAALAATAWLAPAARAQVQDVAIFRSGISTQSGPTTATLDYYFTTDRLFETNLGDVTSASVTYPGPGSPGTLTAGGTVFQYAPSAVATLADLNAAYPTGDYVTSWSGGTAGSGSATIDDTGDIYPNVPLLTAATYNTLTGAPGLYAGVSNTLSWNLFTPNAAANENDIFFSITNAATSATAFSESFLPSTTTSATLAAGTLAPNTAYDLDLDFSSRLNGTSGATSTTEGFDQVSLLSFTTAPQANPAVPEPSAFALLALGLLPVGLIVHKRCRASRCAL